MAKKKLTKSELGKLQDLQSRRQATASELGNIELDKMVITNRRKQVEAFIVETSKLELEVVKTLEDKYGIGSIDLKDGVFIPQETADTKLSLPKSKKEVVLK